MSNERIAQCKADIAKLQQELKRLEEEAARPKPRHGDVVTTSSGDLRIVVIGRGGAKAYNACGILQTGGDIPFSIESYYASGYYTVVNNVFDRTEKSQ